jgi:hypothetical protein
MKRPYHAILVTGSNKLNAQLSKKMLPPVATLVALHRHHSSITKEVNKVIPLKASNKKRRYVLKNAI